MGFPQPTGTSAQTSFGAVVYPDPVIYRFFTEICKLIDYCRTSMACSHKEQFRLLLLDKRNQLIADEVQPTGTVHHTPLLSARGDQARAGTVGDRPDPGAQVSHSIPDLHVWSRLIPQSG
jgi:hypothetical protein